MLTGRLTHRSWLSTLSIALIGFLMLTLLAACGSDSDDTDTNATSTEMTSTETTSGNATDPTEADTDAATSASGDMGDAMAIGLCLQNSTDGDIVNDLRDGNTDSAEDMYRECLGDALPESMVSQLDPIIEQAGTCGSDAAADLSDEDVAAIEDGDDAAIQDITTATLECLSADLGIDLQ